MLTIANNGHHYHPHHSKLDVPDSSNSSSSAVKVKLGSKPLIKAKSRDDDLMASLEMMESLAADLPQNGNGNSNLKRSYTVQHRSSRNTSSHHNGKEEGKKPPLPKISHPQLSTYTTSSHSNGNNLKQVLNSRITSGSSPNLPLHSSPRLTRPKELFVRQITLPMESYEAEETPIVPSPSLATPQKSVPPPIPARRYPRVYHQLGHSSNTDESENDLHRRGSESSPKNFRSNESSPNNFRSNDSGILTSPSPPTDSGIALSPPTQPRTSLTKPPDEFADSRKNSSKSSDTVSLSSSESDTTSGSRYDNVVSAKQSSVPNVTTVHLQSNNRRVSTGSTPTSKTSTLVAAAAEIAARKLNNSDVGNSNISQREISTQTLEDGIDGDDEDEETSDSSSDILVLDSSSANSENGCKKYEYDDEDLDDEIDEDLDDEEEEEDGTKNHDEIEISDHFRRRGNSRRKFKRDSGPYDNFTLPGAVSSSSSRNSPASSVTAEGHLSENKTKGFTKLLAAGPTSNV